jgi:hypothetical protein
MSLEEPEKAEMTMSSEAPLGLTEYLTRLQAELSKVLAQEDSDELRYSLDGVSLEVDVSCALADSADSRLEATPEFQVLGFAAHDNAASTQRHVQHLIVHLARRPYALVQTGSEQTSADIPRAPMPPMPPMPRIKR